MEVWILLAAAGSGYLARRWQNSQRPKGLSSDEAEDDNREDLSHNRPSTRGRYRRFSSSAKRPVGKSMCGKGSPYWVRTNRTGNLTEDRAGNKSMGEQRSKSVNVEDHICDNADGCEICVDSTAAKFKQNKSIFQLDDDKKDSIHREESHDDTLSQEKLSLSRAGNIWKEVQGNGGDEANMNLQGGEDSSYASLLRSMSGKRSNDNLDERSQRNGQLYQDGCAGKRMKDALESSNTVKLNEGGVFESWMPGFWDVSEGVFVLDTESLFVQQSERSMGSSSRKSRTPGNHGRNKGFRKKRLAGQKPMSSLESCLSAQVGEDYSKRQTKNIRQPDDDIPKNSGSRSSRHSASFVSESMVYISKSEFAIGLPSLSRMPSSKRFPSKTRTPRPSFDCNEAREEPFNPFACRRYESAGGPKWESRKGRCSSSIKGLLFNFGVGVGMMFTLMSNMREVRRLTLLLKDAELLIKALEDELESKEKINSDLGSAKHDPKLEQRQSFVASTLRKVKSATDSLCNMQIIQSTEPGASLSIERAPSKDMSKLEAELEAELARMELSLDDGNNFKPQNGSSEVDGEVENMVHGELTIVGLPHELEAYSDEDSCNSSHEDLQVGNYAVSPRALAKRLHEVLEAQQEEKIRELEAELTSLSSRLQAKEEEARWLKENYKGFRAAGSMEGLSAAERKLQQSPQSHSQLKGSHRKEGSYRKEPFSLLKMVPSPNAASSSPHTSCKGFNDASLFNKEKEDKRTAFITLGGEALEAYKEACDEFSKLSISGAGSTSVDEKRPSERHGKEISAQDGKAETKHLGSSEGWEQVDLLSLAQDFYGGGGHELLESMPILSKGAIRERRGPRRKSRIKGHPEPENSFSSSRVVDSSDDGTNDTSGSTPCSIKFIDIKTAGYSNDAKQEGDEALDSLPPSDFDWSPEILIRAGVNTPNQEDYESIHPEVAVDWKLPDESDFSELDEHLGQWLIKRIVEKSRKGSPIVQDAQTVLARLEKNEPIHTSD